jgi:transcriptional regulator with XRE-family HTH domain
METMTPEKLKRIRKRMGITQRELANRLDVTVTTVARWEMGVRGMCPENKDALLQLAKRREALQQKGEVPEVYEQRSLVSSQHGPPLFLCVAQNGIV